MSFSMDQYVELPGRLFGQSLETLAALVQHYSTFWPQDCATCQILEVSGIVVRVRVTNDEKADIELIRRLEEDEREAAELLDTMLGVNSDGLSIHMEA